jgi:hypothetical protein
MDAIPGPQKVQIQWKAWHFCPYAVQPNAVQKFEAVAVQAMESMLAQVMSQGL